MNQNIGLSYKKKERKVKEVKENVNFSVLKNPFKSDTIQTSSQAEQ